MKFGKQLAADSGFPWGVREQRRVEQWDERLWHRFDTAVQSSAQNGTQHRSRFNRRLGADVRSPDRLIDLIDELSRERDSDGHAVGILNAGDRSLHNSAEMKREAIGRLCGPHLIAERVQIVAEITKL
jgi:hypothetical protein